LIGLDQHAKNGSRLWKGQQTVLMNHVTVPSDAAAIKYFVTEILGCRCPDDVFEQIEDYGTAMIPGLAGPIRRLLIGRRLLIYILECDEPAALSAAIPVLVEKGKVERDDHGYNRLRVVIAASQPDSIEHEAEELFARLSEVDEKVHLHVLARCHSVDRIGPPTRV
jgi:hypothetical protein